MYIHAHVLVCGQAMPCQLWDDQLPNIEYDMEYEPYALVSCYSLRSQRCMSKMKTKTCSAANSSDISDSVRI